MTSPLVGSARDMKKSCVSYRRLVTLTAVLLTATAGVAGFGIHRALAERPWNVQLGVWSACAMLIMTTLVVLLLGRFTLHRFYSDIAQRLRVLRREDRLEQLEGPVPEDLRHVMAELGEYVESVRARVDRLHLQKHELDLQTARTEAERRRAEAILLSISDAVLVVDRFGELTLFNHAAERLFGLRQEAAQHQPIERVLDDPVLVGLIHEARNRASGPQRRVVEYSTARDGRTQMYQIALSPVSDMEESPNCGVVAVFHDITHEREMGQIKTEFVSAVSHELRTPLSSIVAYVEMLIDGEVDDESSRQRFYSIIQSETKRLERLIENVLNISRIESGVMEVHRKVTNANQVVQSAVEMLAPQAENRSIVLTCELEEKPPFLLADPDMLYQAVLNVAGNALKYTAPGGRVQVETAVDHETDRLIITVIDNGVGIRSQDISRVFDKFYRSHDGMEMAKGTGLGLSLVKQIIETVHEGEISIMSERGSGTTLAMCLPHLIR